MDWKTLLGTATPTMPAGPADFQYETNPIGTEQARPQSAGVATPIDPINTRLDALTGIAQTQGQRDSQRDLAWQAANAISDGGLSIKAWHGSPYSFPAFDMSKIGTGEGAQAYSHGLYFAGREGTAWDYRNRLAGKPAAIVNGEEVPLNKLPGGINDIINATHLYDHRAITETLLDYMADIRGIFANPELHPKKLANPQYVRQMERDFLNYEDALKWMQENKIEGKGTARPGSMYEVELQTEPDKLLNWDAGQNPQVRAALERNRLYPFGYRSMESIQDYLPFYDQMGQRFKDIGISLDKTYGHGTEPDKISLREWGGKRIIDPEKDLSPEMLRDWNRLLDASDFANSWRGHQPVVSGDAIWQYLRKAGASPAFASEQLREAGIPGNMYLDAGSRAAGQGTHNYVMFDDKLIKILRQYGILPAAVGSGAVAAAGRQEQ